MTLWGTQFIEFTNIFTQKSQLYIPIDPFHKSNAHEFFRQPPERQEKNIIKKSKRTNQIKLKHKSIVISSEESANQIQIRTIEDNTPIKMQNSLKPIILKNSKLTSLSLKKRGRPRKSVSIKQKSKVTQKKIKKLQIIKPSKKQESQNKQQQCSKSINRMNVINNMFM